MILQNIVMHTLYFILEKVTSTVACSVLQGLEEASIRTMCKLGSFHWSMSISLASIWTSNKQSVSVIDIRCKKLFHDMKISLYKCFVIYVLEVQNDWIWYIVRSCIGSFNCIFASNRCPLIDIHMSLLEMLSHLKM